MKSLNEIVAELRMGDDGGKPAYRIGRADKVEVSMPSGTPMRLRLRRRASAGPATRRRCARRWCG